MIPPHAVPLPTFPTTKLCPLPQPTSTLWCPLHPGLSFRLMAGIFKLDILLHSLLLRCLLCVPKHLSISFLLSVLGMATWCSPRMWDFCVLPSLSDMCMLTRGNHSCTPLLSQPLKDAADLPSPPLVVSCNKIHYFKLVWGIDCLLLLWLNSTQHSGLQVLGQTFPASWQH